MVSDLSLIEEKYSLLYSFLTNFQTTSNFSIFLSNYQIERRNVPSHYIQNPSSMIQMTYKCVYLVARKPFKTPPIQQETTPTNNTAASCTIKTETPSPWPLEH